MDNTAGTRTFTLSCCLGRASMILLLLPDAS
jgi:hypothetical protein